jgi:hypothetical protein
MADLLVLPTTKTLKVAPHKRRAPKPVERREPAGRWPLWVAIGAVGVGGLLLVLSLQHLAHGIVAITGASMMEAMLLAIGIDAGLVVTELAAIVATPAVARSIRLYVCAVIDPDAEHRFECLGLRPAFRGADGLRQRGLRHLRPADGVRSVQAGHRTHGPSLITQPRPAPAAAGFFVWRPPPRDRLYPCIVWARVLPGS